MSRRTLSWLLPLLLVGCTDGQKEAPLPRSTREVLQDLDNKLEDAKVKAARIRARMLVTVLQEYKVKNGDYPASLQELTQPQPDGGKALVEADSLLDPWGKTYQFDPTGPNSKGARPDVWTMTPDGKKIGNWPDQK